MMLRLPRHLEEWLITFLIGSGTLLCFMTVLHRLGLRIAMRLGWEGVHDWLFVMNLSWAPPVSCDMLVWMVLCGAAYGVRTGIHLGVDCFIHHWPVGMRSHLVLFGLLAGAFFTGVLGSLGVIFVWHSAHLSPAATDLGVPVWLAYLGIPFGLFLMCFRFLEVARPFYLHALWPTVLPVAIVMGLSVLTCLPIMTSGSLEARALRLFSDTGLFEIMAIPGFILAGNFIIPGGKARQGLPPRVATGTSAAVGWLGRLIPAMMLMVLYGVSTNSSIAALFIASVIPGLMLVSMLGGAWWSTRRHPSPCLSRATWQPLWLACRPSVWGLVLILLVVMALSAGALTVIEAGSVSAVYAFVVAVFIRNAMPLKWVPGVLLDSAKRSVMLLCLLISGFLFADLLTYENIHLQLAHWVMEAGVGQVGFLLAVNLLLVIASHLLAPASIIPIAAPVLVPVLFPVAVVLGIDPILFGVIIVISLGIGTLRTPAGLNLGLVDGISRGGVVATGIARLLWLFIMLLFLILIARWPILSLWLPRTLGML
jgi:C4-dicarboxylate transporter DctM subunit